MEFMEAIQVPNEQAYLEVLCGELDLSKSPFIFMKRLLISANNNKFMFLYSKEATSTFEKCCKWVENNSFGKIALKLLMELSDILRGTKASF